MSETHTPTIAASLRGLVPTVILAILTAIVTTWFSIRDASQEMRFKQEVMNKTIEAISAANDRNAAALQQVTIKLTEQGKDIENLKEWRK